jgi:hypothetical protein
MPFETVALDFIIKLLVSQGYDSILTVTNQGCTKVAIFIPCNEDITVKKWPFSISNMCLPTLDYQPKS